MSWDDKCLPTAPFSVQCNFFMEQTWYISFVHKDQACVYHWVMKHYFCLSHENLGCITWLIIDCKPMYFSKTTVAIEY